MNEPRALTPAHRRAILNSDLMWRLKKLGEVVLAKREHFNKIIIGEEQSYTTRNLMSGFYSELYERGRYGMETSAALSMYEGELRRELDSATNVICMLTGCGYFDFCDWLTKAQSIDKLMKRYEREEERFHQSVYARNRVAAHVTNLIEEELK